MWAGGEENPSLAHATQFLHWSLQYSLGSLFGAGLPHAVLAHFGLHASLQYHASGSGSMRKQYLAQDNNLGLIELFAFLIKDKGGGQHGGLVWPHRGGSQRREPQKNVFTNFKKVSWSQNGRFSLRIYTIFCMRGAVYISDGSRMRAGPLRPLTNPSDLDLFWGIFRKLELFYFGSPWGYGSLVLQWGHTLSNQRKLRRRPRRRPSEPQENQSGRASHSYKSCQATHDLAPPSFGYRA